MIGFQFDTIFGGLVGFEFIPTTEEERELEEFNYDWCLGIHLLFVRLAIFKFSE